MLMARRLQLDELSGPNGETVKVSWMPENRIRIDFVGCGPALVTKVFPKEDITHVELTYSATKTKA
jgi:hypothetical protein